jgi:uncharacterized protein YqgV (UPF0045/DUF77 family)
MTSIGGLNVVPIRKGSMSGEVAKAIDALEEVDLTYETNPMASSVKERFGRKARRDE